MKSQFSVKGMICESCEKIISKQVATLSGIRAFKVDYKTGIADVEYNENKISLDEIKNKIEEKGYDCSLDKKEKGSNWFKWILIGLGIILVGYFAMQLYFNVPIPELSKNMSYGLLFIVGLLTGFHCIAMCGGFVVSYTTKGAKEGKKPYMLHASYAIGKTISYTVIGAIFGLLGSIIAFTPTMRGVAGIIAGIFLLIFGIKMLGLFPSLNRFGIHTPKFLARFIGQESRLHSQSPLIIGLLNGLMIACGPLQAVYIMAAGTGSMIEGAKMLFIFGLGTLPVMLGFGYITSIISSKATKKILKFSGIVVIILGIIMLNRGLALAGTGYDFGSISDSIQGQIAGAATQNSDQIIIKDGYQEIRMTVDNSGFTPNQFVLKKGIPVKWIIDGKQLNSCNNEIIVPKYGLDFKVQPGLQTIEFTPTEDGVIPWSCWMGMLRGTFIVTSDSSLVTPQTLTQTQPARGGMCGGSGGCGCGGRV